MVEALTCELAGEKIDLPSFPDVAMRVRKALTNEEVDIEDVVRIVSAEPALAARLHAARELRRAEPRRQAPHRPAQPPCRASASTWRAASTIAFAMSQLRRAEAYKGVERALGRALARVRAPGGREPRGRAALHPMNADAALLAGLLQGVGKLYLLTRAARFPALLADAGTYQRSWSEWHLRVAQAILRNWDMADEIIKAVGACENLEREHAGATDLTDVLPSAPR